MGRVGRMHGRWGSAALRRGGMIVLAAMAALALDRGATPARAQDPPPASRPVVCVGRIAGAIGPIASRYLQAELKRAEQARAQLYVLELDTPGGLDGAMREMVQAILASAVPVAVYVCPSGARAASAGVFVLTAAGVAAMAPATNVGAAHPVSLGQGMDSTMTAKVTNDAVAYLRGLARLRGRNQEWCEKAVRASVSLPAEDALAQGIIDLVVPDLPRLLAACDGRRVKVGEREVALATAGADVQRRDLSGLASFLQHITDPTIAYLLLLLGFYGLFFELSNPHAILPGVVGALCLLLAFLAFQSLPVNYVGVLLILLGLVLLLLEVKVTSHGVLAVGGGLALLLGSMLLFEPGPSRGGGLGLGVILPAVLVTVLFFLTCVGVGIAAQRRRHRTGLEAMVGEMGEVVRAGETPEGGSSGRALVHGELWEFQAPVPLRRGDRVEVVACEGRVLRVVKVDATADTQPGD